MGQRLTGLHGCVHENENMCWVLASKDRHPLGESPVIFCYTYVSSSESPLKCRKACEA